MDMDMDMELVIVATSTLRSFWAHIRYGVKMEQGKKMMGYGFVCWVFGRISAQVSTVHRFRRSPRIETRAYDTRCIQGKEQKSHTCVSTR
jgi:serine protease inhibitor ecotin